jgi:hypothetical protein
MPIPEVAWTKAWVCGRLLAGVVGLNLVRYVSLASGVCCQVEVSATGRLLVQRTRCRAWYVRVQSRQLVLAVLSVSSKSASLNLLCGTGNFDAVGMKFSRYSELRM